MMFDEITSQQSIKQYMGKLTAKEALIGGYYRLLNGEHAGRVIIKCRERIDDKEVVRFANGLTWIELDKIADVRCEFVMPTFSDCASPIDYSEATWYNDNSDIPQHHNW